jgi:predicted Rossmann fold nucleotide-binding protein DprA/Smf involved in DNA uptake
MNGCGQQLIQNGAYLVLCAEDDFLSNLANHHVAQARVLDVVSGVRI